MKENRTLVETLHKVQNPGRVQKLFFVYFQYWWHLWSFLFVYNLFFPLPSPSPSIIYTTMFLPVLLSSLLLLDWLPTNKLLFFLIQPNTWTPCFYSFLHPIIFPHPHPPLFSLFKYHFKSLQKITYRAISFFQGDSLLLIELSLLFTFGFGSFSVLHARDLHELRCLRTRDWTGDRGAE